MLMYIPILSTVVEIIDYIRKEICCFSKSFLVTENGRQRQDYYRSRNRTIFTIPIVNNNLYLTLKSFYVWLQCVFNSYGLK